MKLNYLATIAVTVIVVASLDCVAAVKEKKGGHRRKLKPIDPMDDGGLSKEPEFVSIPSVCHKIALRRCGQNFMKLFSLVHYLDGMDHYNAQCALRKAFFACHEKLRQKPCKQKKQLANGEEKKFVAKLSEAIWATRVCVLGIQRVDEIPQSGRIERKRV
ncbi:uncharacterized protein LOC100905464 [Galendromus occidentalis]|uniref:Uncharacterized protein LOC100905464 n=1 Tax=Galendromus occidentalis TaxID=34638 RepID=A0AAJ6QNU4_9ACAR|nr:uncharacterized protein LOC100905464 [Galendromus occidentalis]